jgi:multicomponent Na+:H+ antiporter subunit E
LIIMDAIRTHLSLAAILLLLWYGLSDNAGWLFALPAIAVTLFLTSRLLTPSRYCLSFYGLLQFLFFFLHKSIAGGLDVAWRALSPGMPLDIHEFEHRFQVSNPSARTVFIGTLSLMPGTLSVTLAGDVLTVHSIAGDTRQALSLLEKRSAALFQPLRAGQSS